MLTVTRLDNWDTGEEIIPSIWVIHPLGADPVSTAVHATRYGADEASAWILNNDRYAFN